MMRRTKTESNNLVGISKQVTYTCKILGSHSSVAEDSLFAGCDAVSLSVYPPTFYRHNDL